MPAPRWSWEPRWSSKPQTWSSQPRRLGLAERCRLGWCRLGRCLAERCRLGRCLAERCRLGRCLAERCRQGWCRLGWCRLGRCRRGGVGRGGVGWGGVGWGGVGRGGEAVQLPASVDRRRQHGGTLLGLNGLQGDGRVREPVSAVLQRQLRLRGWVAGRGQDLLGHLGGRDDRLQFGDDRQRRSGDRRGGWAAGCDVLRDPGRPRTGRARADCGRGGRGRRLGAWVAGGAATSREQHERQHDGGHDPSRALRRCGGSFDEAEQCVSNQQSETSRFHETPSNPFFRQSQLLFTNFIGYHCIRPG